MVMALIKPKIYKLLQNLVKACIALCILFVFTAFYKLATKPYYEKITKEHLETSFKRMDYDYSKVEQIYQSLSKQVTEVSSLRDEVTVITAYFSLGTFRKGDNGVYTAGLYRKWMTIFKNIANPTIAYFDDVEFCNYFKVLRQHLPSNVTQVIYIDRKDLWAFQIQKKIEEIFKQPGYPEHSPNTVKPEYSCAMHAKYELMKRHMNVDEEPLFGIFIPKHFSETSMAYGLVTRRNPTLTPTDIVYINSEWVCGCIFIGRSDVMLRWTLEYMEGVDWLLKKKLMSTDQQVIYILENNGLIKTPIQAFENDGAYQKWFHLGYLARDAWHLQKKKELLNLMLA